jgi:hypothetical protein
MSLEPQEIEHCLALAANVYAERYETPLEEGVLARAFWALRGLDRERLTETEALAVLIRKQSWAMHRRMMMGWFKIALKCYAGSIVLGGICKFKASKANSLWLPCRRSKRQAFRSGWRRGDFAA